MDPAEGYRESTHAGDQDGHALPESRSPRADSADPAETGDSRAEFDDGRGWEALEPAVPAAWSGAENSQTMPYWNAYAGVAAPDAFSTWYAGPSGPSAIPPELAVSWPMQQVAMPQTMMYPGAYGYVGYSGMVPGVPMMPGPPMMPGWQMGYGFNYDANAYYDNDGSTLAVPRKGRPPKPEPSKLKQKRKRTGDGDHDGVCEEDERSERKKDVEGNEGEAEQLSKPPTKTRMPPAMKDGDRFLCEVASCGRSYSTR